jgi:hypothetical protein
MPSLEYLYDDNVYENEISVNNDNEFTKIQRKRKNGQPFFENDECGNGKINTKKNKLFIGKDENERELYIYGSKGQGNYIYSATSGYKTNYKVGSLDEDLFFSVIDSRANDTIKEPITFYFDSPEQFERLLNCSVSQECKEKWHNKFLIARNRVVNSNK